MCCCCRRPLHRRRRRSPWPRASWRLSCCRRARSAGLAGLRAALVSACDDARGRSSACCPSLFSAVLVAAGFFGSRDPLSNPLPLVVWTLLWVGLTLVQGMLGNLWAWINPWYGPYWLARRLGRRRRACCSSPSGSATGRRSFCLPASHGSNWSIRRRTIRRGSPWSSASTGCVHLAATLVFGYRDWSRRGEFLSVFFGMVRASAIAAKSQRRPAGPSAPGCPAQNSRPAPLPPSGVAVPAAGARVGILRRAVAHFLLARPERHQSARISRSLGDDRHQHARAAAVFVGIGRSLSARSRWPARGWPQGGDVRRARPASMCGRSCRSRSPTISPTI